MTKHEKTLCLLLTVLWLPAAGIAAETVTVTNQPTVAQETQPKSGSGTTSSASKEKAGKKSDVQSRGLFKKKKKKQKDASAAHSQPSEKTDPPTQ
jgi:hypothetical protein